MMDYSGMSFVELLALDCLTYKILFKDALVFKLKQTEEGREYLETCWILKQTAPNREKLRKNFKKVGE